MRNRDSVRRKRLPTPPLARRWAILLAGGEGLRMRPLIRRRLGDDRPKQYCAFYGARSMLEHTAHRAAKLVPPHRILTVIGNGHGRFLGENALPGRTIEQPLELAFGPQDRPVAAGSAGNLPLALYAPTRVAH